MIGRRFWPHGAWDSACALLHQAVAWRRQGIRTEVLTPKYAASWPEKIIVREVPVHRRCMAPRRDWTMGKYIRSMTAWVTENGGKYDLIYVDSTREELLSVMDVTKQFSIPVVAKLRGGDNRSDFQWWSSSRNGKKCSAAASRVNGLVVQDAMTERELLIRGIERQKIFRIPNGFSSSNSLRVQGRLAARSALAAANSDLATEPDSPVLLCQTSMNQDSGVDLLVQTARFLLLKYPNLRIWLVGDGPNRDSIYKYLRADGLRASVAMPGSFCDPSDLFLAADLYLQTDDNGLDYFLPTAISSKIPVICVDLPSIRRLLDGCLEGQQGASSQAPSSASPAFKDTLNRVGDDIVWCQDATPKAVKEAIVSVLQNMDQASERAERLRDALVRVRSEGRCTEAYVEMIKRLTRARQR